MDRKLFAQVKRFRERWMADDVFRAIVLRDPGEACSSFGLEIDHPERLSNLWGRPDEARAATPEGEALRATENQARSYLAFCAADDGAVDGYVRWRTRQKARSAFAQGYVTAPLSLHLPYTVELTNGCSVGCWFCGLSAHRLDGVLSTDIPAWEAMLRALREVFGESTVRGFLYWATDPLDHPDYEAYGEAFGRVLGRFPATTTAAPLVDVDRTRRLLGIGRAGDCPSIRFSVLSKRQLNEIHSAFTAEELADVELVPVNRESVLGLAQAGHVREKEERMRDRVALEKRKLSEDENDEIFAHRTIACVSGFLIEPVLGRVRLISPEPCSDQWPDGYAVFDEAHYSTPEEFAEGINGIVERNMGAEPPERLALQRGVAVEVRSPTHIHAEARGWWVDLRSKQRPLTHVPALAEAFRGGADFDRVVRDIAREFEVDPRLVRSDAAELWRRGVLIETFFSFADLETAPRPVLAAVGAAAQ